jgi:hypothetical protein
LPNGVFSNTKSQFLGKKFQGLRLENFDVFYGHLEYIMTIWYILCSLGIFSGFGIMNQVKSGNPGSFPTEFIVEQYTEAVIKFFIANVVEGNCVKVESERLRKTIFFIIKILFRT